MAPIRCYKCNGSGHKEADCDPKVVSHSVGLVRATKPIFVLKMNDLNRVTIGNGGSRDVVVPPFGLEVTADTLRVHHDNNQIAFFGHPIVERTFTLILPGALYPIHFVWSAYCVNIHGRFSICGNVFRSVKNQMGRCEGDIDFVVRCYGAPTTTFGFDSYSGEGVDAYRVFVRTGTVSVAEADVASHIRQWTRDEDARLAVEKANREKSEVAKIVDEMVDAAANSPN